MAALLSKIKYRAKLLKQEKGRILVEQRNKFSIGDELEILSPSSEFNKILKIEKMTDETGTALNEAKNVQQKIWIYTNQNIKEGDILRK